MAHTSFSILRLVLVPTLVTLGVTVLRLAGELLGWPSPWFDKTNGLVGITWILPPIFGFYFAWKTWEQGERIDRIGRAFLLGFLGVVLNQLVEATVFQYADISIYGMLVILWTVAIISAYLQYLAWPALCRTLIAYGLGARIPVVVIMFFALRGHWGTHYDRPSGPFTLGFWPTFLLFGFFEELNLLGVVHCGRWLVGGKRSGSGEQASKARMVRPKRRRRTDMFRCIRFWPPICAHGGNKAPT